jgi:hypothetical protein
LRLARTASSNWPAGAEGRRRKNLLTQHAIAAAKATSKPVTLEGIVANLLELTATDR